MVRISVLKSAVPTKIFQRFNVTKKRLPIHFALMYCPQHEVRGLIARALASGVLTRNTLQKSFLAMQKFGDHRRAMFVAKAWEEETTKKLSEVHLNTLMTIGVHSNRWQMSLQFWEKLTADPSNVITPLHYTTLLSALRCGGLWRRSLHIVQEMEEDRVPWLPEAQHVVLQTLRQNTSWRISLSFAAAKVHKNLEENTNVLSELFWLLADQRKQTKNKKIERAPYGVTNRALQVLRSHYEHVPVEDRSLGLNNSIVAALVVHHQWEKAFQIVGRTNHATTHTIAELVHDSRGDFTRLTSLLEYCSARSIPIPSSLFRATFRWLLSNGKDKECVEMYMRWRDVAMTTNAEGVVSFQTLNAGMLDALLSSHQARTSYAIALHLQECIGHTVPLLTQNMCVFGSEHTRHVIPTDHGRIAVVDLKTFTSREIFGKLSSVFNHIFIPYSVVRGYVAAGERVPINADAIAFTLRQKAKELSHHPTSSSFTFLSFLSQLYSHQYATGEMKLLLANSGASHKQNKVLLNTPTSKVETGNDLIVIRSASTAVVHHPSVEDEIDVAADHAQLLSPSMSYNRCVAVGLMLRGLNPGNDVYVVTGEEDTVRTTDGCGDAQLKGIYAKSFEDVTNYFAKLKKDERGYFVGHTNNNNQKAEKAPPVTRTVPPSHSRLNLV